MSVPEEKIAFTNASKVEDYVKRGLKVYSADGSIPGGSILLFTRILFVLGDLVDIPMLSENRQDKRGVIWGALTRIRADKSKSAADFTDALKEELHKIPSPFSYIIVSALNLKYACLGGRRSVTLPGGLLRFYSLAQASSKLDIKTAFADRRDNSPDGRDPFDLGDWTLLSVKVEARDTSQALAQADAIVEPFRALLNLSEEYGRLHWRAGYPQGRSKVPASRYMYIFDKNGKYVEFGYHLHPYAERAVDFHENQLATVWKSAGLIRSVPAELLRRIAIEALRLYVQALDERENHLAFLSLWQGLELLTRKAEGQSETEVVERVAGIFFNNPTIVDPLWILLRKRNKLVHEGRADLIEQDDVNILKSIVERMIGSYLVLAQRLRDEGELIFLYQQATAERRTLRRRSAILRGMIREAEKAVQPSD